MKRVSKLKTRIPKFFGVAFELLKKLKLVYYSLLYRLHIRTRLGHDLAYKNLKWYKGASDSKVPASVRKVSVTAFVLSFIVFSLAQSLLPSLFNLGNPNQASAASSYKQWSSNADFAYNKSAGCRQTSLNSSKVNGPAYDNANNCASDGVDSTLTLADPSFNWEVPAKPSGGTVTTDYASVWTGTELAVIGGKSSGSGFVTKINFYNPVTNQWRLSSVYGNGADTKSFPGAVYTGETGNQNTSNKIIIWGGQDGSYNYVNTGYIYDIQSDTWSPTSTIGAPSGRNKFATVWTGSKMIVQGGLPNLSDGGIYDPATDTWESIPSSGVGRSQHSIFWTGTKLLSWGSVNTNVGQIYDPASGTWSNMSITNAPNQRSDGAVWTGSKMIAWGGSDAVIGIYNPASDTWTRGSTVNMPEVRTSPNVSWTGSKMIVYGGTGSYTIAGSIYDPASDSWTSLPGGGPISAFAAQTWTGSKYIIWSIAGGGTLSQQYSYTGTASGYRLDAGENKKAKWNTISWNGVTPTNGSSTTAIKFRTRGTNSTNQTILDNPDTNMTGNPNTGWTYWNQDNTGNTYYTSTGSTVSTPPTRYLDIQLTLTSNDGALTPTLNDFRVDYDSLELPSGISVTRTNDTAISAGGFTNESSVKVKATNLACTDCGTSTQRKIEVEAYTTTATGNPTATGEYNDTTHDSTATLTGLQVGVGYKLKVRAVDQQGRQTDWVDYNSGNTAFTIDQTPPTATVSIGGANVSGGYSKSNLVDLTIVAKDETGGSGLSNNVNLAVANGNNTPTTWSNWATSVTWGAPDGSGNRTAIISNFDLTTLGGDGSQGSHKVYEQVKDNAGNDSKAFQTSDTDFNSGVKTNLTVSSGSASLALFDSNNWISGTVGTALEGKQVYSSDAGIFYWQSSPQGCSSPQCVSGLDTVYPSLPNTSFVRNNAVDFTGGDPVNPMYPARQACKLLGGYLPTMAELRAIYNNKAGYGNNFLSVYYWTSTGNNGYAYYKSFSGGAEGSSTSNAAERPVRCIRTAPTEIYVATGSLVSEVIDTASSDSSFGGITWSDSVPAGTSINVQIRAGEDNTPDDGTGNWTVWSGNLSKNDILTTYNGKRFLQYNVTLNSNASQALTPVFSDISIPIYATASISVDTQKPTTPTAATPNSWGTSNKPTFTWSASSDPGSGLSKYELKIGSWTKTITNATVGVTPANPLNQTEGDITYTLQNGEELSQGSKTWEIKATDNINNASDATSQTFGYDSDNSPGPVVNLVASTNNSDRVRISWDKFADSGSPITKYKIERIQTGRITEGENDWSLGNVTTTGYALFEIDNPAGPVAPVFWDFSPDAPLNQIPQYQTDQYTIYSKLVPGVRYTYRVLAKDSAYNLYDVNVSASYVGYTNDTKSPYSPYSVNAVPCDQNACPATDSYGHPNVKGYSNKITWEKAKDEGIGLGQYRIYRSVTNYTPQNPLNQETDRGDWTLVGILPIVSEAADDAIWYDNDLNNQDAGSSMLNDYVRYYYRVTAVDKNNNESRLIPLDNREYDPNVTVLDPGIYNSNSTRTFDVTPPQNPETFYVLRKGIDASNVTQKVEIRWNDANDYVGQDTTREPRMDSNGNKLTGSGIKEYKLYYAKEDKDAEGKGAGTYGSWTEFVYDINDINEYSKSNGINSVIQTGLEDYWNYKFKIKTIDNAIPNLENELELAQPVKTFSSAIPSSPSLQVSSIKSGNGTGKTLQISFPGSKSKAHNIVKYEVFRGTAYDGEDGGDWVTANTKVREFTPAVTHFDDSAQTYSFEDTPISTEAEGAKIYYYMVKVSDDTPEEEGGTGYNYSVVDKNSLHAGWDTTPDIQAPSAPAIVSVKDTYPNNQYVRNVVTWQIPAAPSRKLMPYETCPLDRSVAGGRCNDFAKYEVWQEKYNPITKALVSDTRVYSTINFYDNIYTDNILYQDLIPGLNPQDYIYKYYVLVHDNAGTDFKYNDVAKTVINSSSNTSTKAYAPDPIIPSQTTPALATGTSVQILEKGVSSAVIYWETNQEADSLVEYREQGSTFAYIAVGDRSRQLTHTVRIFDLKTDTTYEYRVVSRNKLGNDMVITNVPVLRTEKFKIEIPTNSDDFMKVTTTSIQFTWTTTKDAKTNYIEYEAKNDPNNPQLRGIAGQLATSDGYDLKTHQVVLKGLRSNTEYRFKVKSVSTDNYQDEKPEGASNYLHFTTSKYDTSQFTMVPSSSNVSEKNITSTSAQIVWETANPTVSKVFYGTSPAEGSQNNSAGSGELSTNHVAKIEGLIPGTKYYYYVQATDEFGNTYTSKIFSFTAILKPKISGFNISSIKPYEITISWTTNVDTETIVNWGKTAAYGEKRGKNELTKNHLLVIDKLEDNTEYHMQIVAHDETGEEVVDADKIIRTPLDTEGPKIESVKTDILPMGASDETGSVIISWNTNKPASTMVEYDEGIISGRYGMRSVEDKTLNLSHTVIIKELKPASSYHYRIVSRDKRGNTTQSQDFTFVTPSKEKSILQLILKSLEETFSWTKNLNQFFANIGKRIRGQ